MNNIFCIISAIGVEYGVFSYQERFQQLIETIHSIKKYQPSAYICLMEVSDTPIKQQDYEVLSMTVDRIKILHEHKFVKEILVHLDSTDSNRTARKTIGELIAFLEFLGWLRNQNMQFDRIFKISGRLKLNDNFLKIDYHNLSGKIVAKKKFWYDGYAYLIQLWSFDFKLLESMFQLFLEIWNYEIETLTTKSQLSIIETTLHKFVQKNNISVHEIDDYIGIEGFHGQDGAKVFN